jgi:hypothetical protein
MEVLDREYKKQATPLYLGLPLYYLLGVIIFVIANQINLMYWNPDLLELKRAAIEQEWGLCSSMTVAASHFLFLLILLGGIYFEDGIISIRELMRHIIMIPINSFIGTIGILTYTYILVTVFYLPIRFIWGFFAESVVLSQYNLILLCIQFIASLCGAIMVHRMIYKGFSSDEKYF